jgi:hypothetical protein
VAGSAAGEGMRNLMQQRVPNCLVRVFFYEEGGQLDGTLAVAAEAQVDLATVEVEGPAGQAVGGEEFAGQGDSLEGACGEGECLH